jgi:alpha-glucosidase
MIKRLLLLPLLFFVITNTVAQANTASEFRLSSLPHHNYKPRRKWVYLPKLYKFNKEILFRYMHDAQNLFDSKNAYTGEWNIDEKLDINAELIVIGIEHGNDERMRELTP